MAEKSAGGAQVKVRLTDNLRAVVQAAAASRGVSMNSEIVERLQRSLERETGSGDVFDNPLTAAIAKLIAAAMHETGRAAGFAATSSLEGSVDWFANPYAYDQAVRAANRVLEMLRPEGEIKPPSGHPYHDVLGVGFANTILEDAATGHSRTVNSLQRAQALHRELEPLVETIRKNLRTFPFSMLMIPSGSKEAPVTAVLTNPKKEDQP